MISAAVIIFLVYIIIFLKLNYSTKSVIAEDDLMISIVVAAKNEEQNVSNLIIFLTNQQYNKDSYEVIIVDDNSIDGTYLVASNICKTYSNFSVIKAENKIYEGKRGALQIGIEKSKYPYILITDADCEPEILWIKSFSDKFQEGTDFVFGIAPLKQTSDLANKISCFDNLWTHILTFSFAKIELPYSSSARSFGFNKDSFNKIKGYLNTTETLSGDDDLLLREAIKNKMNVGIITNSDAFVFSSAKTSIKDFINQKSRHTSSSLFYSLKSKMILGVWHLINLLFFSSLLFSFFNSAYLFLFIFKFIVDLFVIRVLMKKISYSFTFVEILYLQFLYEIFIVINFINSFSKRNKW